MLGNIAFQEFQGLPELQSLKYALYRLLMVLAVFVSIG